MQFEPLEARSLLSAALSSGGTLFVSGDIGNDFIVVQRDATDAGKILATVNGAGQTFDMARVRRIYVQGLGGNDQLVLDDALAVISRRGATLVGGEGDDTLVGGFAAATFDGGAGNDSITGTSSSDTIVAGDGNDTVVGGGGTDFVLGGTGDDLIAGGRGDDLLYGDAGNDTLYGGDGNDTLGGDGEDRIHRHQEPVPLATPGHDLLNGGNGNDWITGGNESRTLHNQNNGKDTIIGGAGSDILDSRGWIANTNNPLDMILDREARDIVPMEDHTRAATGSELALGDKMYKVYGRARLYINLYANGFVNSAIIGAGVGDFADPKVANTFPRMFVAKNAPNEIVMRDLDKTTFTLGEFFRNWGVTFSSKHIGRYIVGNGKALTFYVKHGDSGKRIAIKDPYNYVIQGATDVGKGDQIIITYA